MLNDKHDLWRGSSDGSGATRLTDGFGDQVRHRYVRVNPDDEWIDLDEPFPVSLFGIWTKKSGYGRVTPGSKSADRLVWLDKSVGSVADGARVGVVGHSWGGFDAAYLTTQTEIFAAGVAGAPITNLVSNYGNHHWSSGVEEEGKLGWRGSADSAAGVFAVRLAIRVPGSPRRQLQIHGRGLSFPSNGSHDIV